MQLKEIISQSDWQDVAIAIVTEHPCQRKNLEGFRIVFETLLLMEPTESEYQIRIERRADMLDSEYTYPDVFGVKEGDEISYSLVFTSWTEWLGMDICQQTKEAFSPISAAASMVLPNRSAIIWLSIVAPNTVVMLPLPSTS